MKLIVKKVRDYIIDYETRLWIALISVILFKAGVVIVILLIILRIVGLI